MLQSGNRSGADAAARGGVKRIGACALDCGQAQRVDRRLGHCEPVDPLPYAAKPEQRLGPASQRSFVVGAAKLNVSDDAIPATMGKSGVPKGTVSHDVCLGRSR